MFDLIDFFNDANVERFFRNVRSFAKDFEKKYFVEDNRIFNVTSFKEVDGYYRVEFDVAKEANAKNVSVDFEDGIVKVSYSHEKDGCKSKFEWKETLPSNADADTLEATVENGKLVITAVAKPKKVTENTTRVRINRK